MADASAALARPDAAQATSARPRCARWPPHERAAVGGPAPAPVGHRRRRDERLRAGRAGRSGAEVSGSDRAESPSLEPRPRAGIDAALGHAARTSRPATTSRSSTPPRSPPRTPSAWRPRERGLPDLPRAELLGELTRAAARSIAVAGAHGKTTTTSMVAHALLACGADARLPDRRRADARPAPTRTGGRGSGWSSRPTSPTARCWRSTPTSRWSPTSSSTTVDQYASLAELRGRLPRVPGRRAAARSSPRASSAWRRRARATFAADGPRAARPAARRFVAEGVPVRLLGARASTTRATPPRRWRRCALAGVDLAGAGGGAGGLPRRRAGASRSSGARPRGALVVDDYAHHPTEVRGDDRRPRGRSAPRRVVAVFQPHLFSRTAQFATRVRRGAGRAPTSPACSTSTRRASAPRTSPASAACSSPRPPPTRAGGRRSCGCRASTTPSRSCATLLRDGDLCLVLGAGDVDALGRRLVA